MGDELVSGACKLIANAITPTGVLGGRDATDGIVSSLTEAVMGVTAGLCKIAESIENLAEAIREGNAK